MSKSNMFLIAGVNGAGKSTYTKTIARKFPDFTVIDPDAIAKSMVSDISRIGEKSVSAGKEALNRVRHCINQQKSFIVESTISGNVYLQYLQKAKQAGFRTILVYIALPNVGKSIERVRDRVKKGGHDIPVEDIKRRYIKSFKNLRKHIDHADIAYIYNNGEHYNRVANFRNGEIYKQFNIPDWIREYLEIQQTGSKKTVNPPVNER